MSDELKTLDSIDWVRKREALPRGSATFAFNQDAANVSTGTRAHGTSNLQDWFGGRYDTEDVIGLGRYGKERAEEDSIRDSWTPRFRR